MGIQNTLAFSACDPDGCMDPLVSYNVGLCLYFVCLCLYFPFSGVMENLMVVWIRSSVAVSTAAVASSRTSTFGSIVKSKKHVASNDLIHL